MSRMSKSGSVVAADGPVMVDDPTNGAELVVKACEPYHVELTIEGTADLMFHRYNVELAIERAKSGKGSKASKVDDLEASVWRTVNGELAVPSRHLHAAIIKAGRRQKDPSNARASCMDLYKGGLIIDPELATLGVKKWDYEDGRKENVGGRGIARVRPCVRRGWRAQFSIEVVDPEFIDVAMLREAVDRAGRICGIGERRPTFGRFHVVAWEVNNKD